MLHWSQNQDHIVVYHGTHKDNIQHILRNGISNKDPRTGMISVAFGSHGKNVAHGYAAMSGERFFRQAGKKAVSVPKEDRRVVVAHLPMDWVRANVDTDFGGNPTEIKARLRSKEAHNQFVAKHGTDFLPHETPELRFKQAIPPEFIVGVKKKKTKYVNKKLEEQSMKSFKEFIETVAEEVPANNASGEASSDGNPKVAKFDPLLSLAKLVRRRQTTPSNRKIPSNDINNYEHPGSAAVLQARSSVGIPGLP